MAKYVKYVLMIMLMPVAAAWAEDGITNSIVKIYTTFDRPSYSRPWQMKGPVNRTGSGCIIDGHLVLTNAHVVSDHTFIQVRRAGKADKYVASVKAVSHELDLALLEVEDKDFFKNAIPLKIGELPKVGQKVIAYGFPRGGTRITITEGIVSRIDRTPYAHSRYSNLVCQIDAAINQGSSGGPVITDGKIAGVTFQSSSGQNIGYMVPAPLVRHFFKDLEDQRHDGVPGVTLVWQNLENPQIREYYGMTEDQSGIMITRVAPLFLGDDILKPLDIILTVDEFNVANDGTVEFRKGERIAFGYAVDRKQVGDTVRLEIIREGKLASLEIPLTVAKTSYGYLIPRLSYDLRPSYFIIGGLVFTRLTEDYLRIWKKWNDVPVRLMRYYYELITNENKNIKDVIVLAGLLPDEINVGYKDFEDYIVSDVNGKKIHSMKDLATAFDTFQGTYHRIILENTQSEIVFLRQALRERNPYILKKYRIQSDRSADLLEETK